MAVERSRTNSARCRDQRRRYRGATRPGILALLVALRVYIFVAVPIVAYAFVHALLTAQ